MKNPLQPLLALLGSLLVALSVTVQASDIVTESVVGSVIEAIENKPAVEKVSYNVPLLYTVPESLKGSNARFLTISSENDFFGNGTDKDYTNGIRFSYTDIGKQQPFYVDWLDRLSPTFDKNATTTSYFSFGQNLYTPQDIKQTVLNEDDRPYAAFTYLSGGLATATDNHIDSAELTLGWVGPSALGKMVQTEYHKLINADKPMGWKHQIKDEPGLILSLERQYPGYLAVDFTNQKQLRLTPHVGVSLGNVYTHAAAGFTLSLMPSHASWQDQPVRVRPAIPGSGIFLTGENDWSWMAFIGTEARLVGRNIFLDGNTFKNSHSVDKRNVVFDATAGVTFNYKTWRLGYSINWRSKEFNSPLAKEQVFGAVSIGHRF